jgi:hypothetical protein
MLVDQNIRMESVRFEQCTLSKHWRSKVVGAMQELVEGGKLTTAMLRDRKPVGAVMRRGVRALYEDAIRKGSISSFMGCDHETRLDLWSSRFSSEVG